MTVKTKPPLPCGHCGARRWQNATEKKRVPRGLMTPAEVTAYGRGVDPPRTWPTAGLHCAGCGAPWPGEPIPAPAAQA